MKKEKDLNKRLEDYRILLVVLVVVMLFFWGKGFLKTQNLVGQQLNNLTISIQYGADFLAQCESEQDQKLMLEMIGRSVSDAAENLDLIAGNTRLLQPYAEKTDDLSFHILCMRVEYQDEQIDVVVEEVQKLAKAISDSEIRKTVAKDGYLYSWDSKNVKEDLDEILEACSDL